jgi:ectoine hydroxylase-related dioxygenase (phytanoyl-CoA dioxygenase family)
MAVLTPEQVADFHRDGYLKFTRVISDSKVEELRSTLDKIIDEERGTNGVALPSRPPEFAFGHDRGGETTGSKPARAIHQFVNMWKVSPEYRELLDNPIITGAVRELMQAEQVRLWHDQVISKPPGDNGHFSCHHDFYFWPLQRPTMITCWMALDDAIVDNGCMHVVPGSHRDPRYQPVTADLSEDIHLSPVPMGPGEPGSLYNDIRTWMPEKAKPVILKAGECMFHHCLNWHLTPQNVTDRQRRAFVMIFMPDGSRYKEAQSPNHCCTNYLQLTDGQTMGGPDFPLCGVSL